MKARGTKRSLAAALVAIAILGLAGTTPAHELEEQSADVAIAAASDTTAVMHLTDGSGNQLFFSVVRDDEDAPWRLDDGLPPQRGIVFGNPQPRLPSIAILRDSGVNPPDVVKPFSLAIAENQFDDLSVYRVSDDEFAIVSIVEDLVTSIYYAGRFLEIVLEAQMQSVPHCDAFKFNCCLTTTAGDPADDENPEVEVPTPHLPSCLIAMTVSPIMMDEICGCLAEACNCSWNTDHPDHEHCVGNPNNMNACIDHCDFCDPTCPPDPDDDDDDDDDNDDDDADDGDDIDPALRKVLDLLEKIVDLLDSEI